MCCSSPAISWGRSSPSGVLRRIHGGWEAIFLLDYLCLRRRHGYDGNALYGLHGQNRGVRKAPLFCWFLGALCGLLVTKTGFIDGPLAKGLFADSSWGCLYRSR